ncbi:hypothetical protein BVRB_9g204630 [Beta vulgaris subsp. vulgaris]|nr:hypothetical protein BVRB_9g204630 [Beta vulgaris subsp. vulgaris]
MPSLLAFLRRFAGGRRDDMEEGEAFLRRFAVRRRDERDEGSQWQVAINVQLSAQQPTKPIY